MGGTMLSMPARLPCPQILPKTTLPMLTLLNSIIQVALTAPLARLSGSSVKSRNRLLLGGFVIMLGAHACFSLPIFANPGGAWAHTQCICIPAQVYGATLQGLSSLATWPAQ